MRDGSLGVRYLGLRAQIAIALVGVLVLAATLAIVAIRPLTVVTAQAMRRRAGVTLARAVAGQVALLPPGTDLTALLNDTVGPGALTGAAMVDLHGKVLARAGTLSRPLPRPPFEDRVIPFGTAFEVVVVLPQRGAFVAEVSLAQTPAERALWMAVVLYTLVAAGAALWVVFALLTRYIVRPVEALTRAAERVAEGKRDVTIEPRGAREVVRAAHAFNTMTRVLSAREKELSDRIEQLERTTRELRAAQNQLVRSERLAVVGRLSAGIAHEVGNPLAAIVGLTDVLKQGGLAEEEVQDFADRIGREAQRIHRTMRELLDYARAAPERSVDTPAAHEEGEVADAVAQVIRLLTPQKSMRGITIDEHVEQSLPRIRLATDRLVQVLLNLVLNAADAIRSRQGNDNTPAISIRAERDGTRVVIEVEDNGPGIPLELRSKVFEPFFTTKPAGEGTGLGLAICAVIVEQAGGSITALDRRDGASGARIRIELPSVHDRPSGEPR